MKESVKVNGDVFTTSSILNEMEPIYFVIHDEDGDWHFLPNRAVSEVDASMASINQMLALDATLEETLSIPSGFMAEREGDMGWRTKEI